MHTFVCISERVLFEFRVPQSRNHKVEGAGFCVLLVSVTEEHVCAANRHMSGLIDSEQSNTLYPPYTVIFNHLPTFDCFLLLFASVINKVTEQLVHTLTDVRIYTGEVCDSGE